MTSPQQEPTSIVSAEVPIAVVMISLNEAHNMEAVLQNLAGWAQQVFLVDSYSVDSTIDIALKNGVHVVQRRFRGFGDQWNFALTKLPITTPWTMKLDPDQRISNELKASIKAALGSGAMDALRFERRDWFMGRPLPVRSPVVRVWRSGRGKFTDVSVHEHLVIDGKIVDVAGDLEHHNSPHLHHWLEKQNQYSTTEAAVRFEGGALSEQPRLFGTSLQRRMWFKTHFWRMPGRYWFLYLYHLLILGAWKAGRIGWLWAHLRTELYRMQEYKLLEMRLTGRTYSKVPSHAGKPDSRVPQYD